MASWEFYALVMIMGMAVGIASLMGGVVCLLAALSLGVRRDGARRWMGLSVQPHSGMWIWSRNMFSVGVAILVLMLVLMVLGALERG